MITYFKQSLPGRWLMRGLEHIVSYTGTIALAYDAVTELLEQGMVAALPGQVRLPGIPGLGGFDSVDALPYLGRDRGIIQGMTETPESYAAALRGWRASRRRAGTAFELLRQLQRVLGPGGPMVRCVNAAGHWHTIEADGSLVYNTPAGDGFRVSAAGVVTAEPGVAHPWDWDSASLPPSPLKDDPYRLWFIIYAPTNPPLTGTGNVYGYGVRFYGMPGESLGTSSTLQHIDMIRGLLTVWKTAGIIIPWIIVAFDPSSFDPLTISAPGDGLPDGLWGWDGKPSGGTIIPSRLSTARYWEGSL